MSLQDANSMAMSGLSCRNALVGARKVDSVLFAIYGFRNKLSFLIAP